MEVSKAEKDTSPPPSFVSAYIRTPPSVKSEPERNKCDELEEEIEFLERPPKETECPLCFQVMTKPVLSSCCGHHFCQSCIDRAIAKNHICPLCNEQGFTTFLDKDCERKIKALKVSCKLKFRGCHWAGELGRLEHHLDMKGGDCEFVEVECEFSCLGCTVKLPRKDLPQHYNSNTHNHLLLSLRTTSRLESRLQEQHQQQDEAMRAIWRSLQQKEQQIQERDSQILAIEQQLEEKDSRILAIEQQVNEVMTKLYEKDEKLIRLEEKLVVMEGKQILQQSKVTDTPGKLQQNVTHTSSMTTVAWDHTKIVIPTPVITMTRVEEHKWIDDDWYSAPFYTHVCGYKMCIRVKPAGHGSGKGTHLSVFIHLMCGEYDEFLQWPFHGEVTFQLLNQRKDGWHVQKSMQMIDSKACIRVVNRRANVLGFGFECFMVNTKLGYNRITGTEYLKNDTLKFRVLSVVLP